MGRAVWHGTSRPEGVSMTPPSLFELNSPVIPDSCRAADLKPGTIVSAEYGMSLVLAVEDRRWRFSENLQRRVTFRLQGTEFEYSSLFHPHQLVSTPDDAAFRRWLVGALA